MKFLSLVIVYYLFILQFVWADKLRRRTRTKSDPSNFFASRSDGLQNECRARTEEDCNQLEFCGWFNGQCNFIIVETCGIFGAQGGCEADTNCVWIFDDESDPRPGASGRCTEKDEVDRVEATIDCSIPQTQFGCNSSKGCSWIKDRGTRYCSVAPTQLVCDDFQTKKSCKKAGCISKKKFKKRGNKERICVGRWENELLSTISGMEGNAAKLAIEEEYDDTYTVVLVNPGENVLYRGKIAERIKLHLNDVGIVTKKPKFG